ncbi:MAG: TerB family tellurite resistance protein [Planctomycetota bacterium]|nr:MAG: TerB family tellurite resistance protein [Planctomycetota bacterium]
MTQNTPHSPQKWFNLEEIFFSEVDHRLLEQLRSKLEVAQTAEQIMQVTGITDQKLAEAMAQLNISVETLAAFRLAPLVVVAWADDRIDNNERFIITRAAEKAGLKPEDSAMELLNAWTQKRPPDALFETWCAYAKALKESLTEVHRKQLRKEILQQVHDVAEAAGGILGFGSISPSEKKVIEQIEEVLA